MPPPPLQKKMKDTRGDKKSVLRNTVTLQSAQAEKKNAGLLPRPDNIVTTLTLSVEG